MRILSLTSNTSAETFRALSNDDRLKILKILSNGPKNINELSELLQIPFSTTALHIKKLEDAKLIRTKIIPGRGSQKISYNRYDQIIITLEEPEETRDQVILELQVGDFSYCEIEPTCGLLNETGIIYLHDEPSAFYDPARKEAQLIWFNTGFVEYLYPNKSAPTARPKEISFSVELCSEAPYHKLDWPSDISCWINGVDIGIYTCPSDFGGERGFLTPDWWPLHNTQYGLLKTFRVTDEGSFVDKVRISDVCISDLAVPSKPYISFRLGIKKESTHQGGINIFGSKFGNHSQGIIMRLLFE